jgi:CHAT domain-containing protein
LPSAAPLPDAAQEVAEIGANYPKGTAVVLTGTSATAAAFRDKAPAAGIIHLAAHAGLNNSDPLSSFVRLGAGTKDSGDTGMVTALDLMSLHLRADLVVLSACETALGTTRPGEGIMGMGWALSAAGASSSVLSLWKVDSTASKTFMTAFYRQYTASGGGVSKSTAMRRAGLEMLAAGPYRHPFYWAAFTLWGDGAHTASIRR